MNANSIFISLFLLLSSFNLYAQTIGYPMPAHYRANYPASAYPAGYYRSAYAPVPVAYRYPVQPAYQYPGYYPAYGRAASRTVQPVKTETRPARVEAKQQAAVKAVKPVTKKISTETSTDKQKFIDLLLPYIEAENRKILQQRNWIKDRFSMIEKGYTPTEKDSIRLASFAKKYRLKNSDFSKTETRQALLSKIDIIPASLTLAQAANESAWGKSRFAKQANNLFGIWTYDADKGLKPKNRESGKKHFVRKFDNAGESVRYYMHMLNSHPAYAKLRTIRQQLRSEDKTIEGYLLARGLEKYSAKGEKYITLIVQLISQNQWALLDTPDRQA